MRQRTQRACCTTSPLTRTPVLAPDPAKNRASTLPSAPCPPDRRRHARTRRGSQHRLHGSNLAPVRPHRTGPCRSSTGRASAAPRQVHRHAGPTFPPNLRHRCRHHWSCHLRGRRGHLRRRLRDVRHLHSPHRSRNWSMVRRATPGRCTVPSPRAVSPPLRSPPQLPQLPPRCLPDRGRQRRRRAAQCLPPCGRIRPSWKRSPLHCPSREVTRARRPRRLLCLRGPLRKRPVSSCPLISGMM